MLVQWPLLEVADAVLRSRPRNHRLVAMGSPLDRFADNAAHLFLYMSDHDDDDVTPVWISGSRQVVAFLRARGYAAERRWSRAGIRTCLTAGTYVYSGYRSDISRWLSSGATALCLWHGIPIKQIHVEGPFPRPRRSRFLVVKTPAQEPAPDILLSSTARVTRGSLATAFAVSEERCWELGYPRNDHLLRSPDDPHSALFRSTIERDRLRGASFVVGMFLTWRDDKAVDVAGAELVARLAQICQKHGAVLAYKSHYNVAPVGVTSPSCVNLPREGDLAAYLGMCDVLITDYSSVAFDFALLARPTLYFMPDLERYRQMRGFYFDPLTLPGTFARDADSLAASLDELLSASRPPTTSQEVEALRDCVWGDYDGHAARGVALALRQDIERRLASQANR
jgi:CDP-glycerol glycerophosphotransferase